MKKLVLGAAATAAVAAGVALVPSVAGATGSKPPKPPKDSVTISQYADYGLNGTNLDIDLQVRCTGGSGVVEVQVDQYYPETPNPLGAHGFSPPTAVVCDGVSRHVTATIVGTLYDGGRAKAIATLVAPSGTTTAKKTITIVAH